MHTNPDKLTWAVKKLAKRLGFDLVGISSPEPLIRAGQKLLDAVEKGYLKGMPYMGRNIAQRSSPKALFPWARSIISVGICYHSVPLAPSQSHHLVPLSHSAAPNSAPFSPTKDCQTTSPPNPPQPLISRYALGRDYHLVLAEKLELFQDELRQTLGREFRSRVAVDTLALMEKPLAQRAGLGWQGKNSLIINSKYGSWIFLGELLTELDLAPDSPIKNQCGSCTACIDACPTRALSESGLLDARKCLSYLSVEHDGPIPAQVLEKLNKKNLCIYGCDICQQICPFNRDTPQTKEQQFHPRAEILNLSPDDLLTMSQARFGKLFCDTSLARLSYKQFRRNLELLRKA